MVVAATAGTAVVTTTATDRVAVALPAANNGDVIVLNCAAYSGVVGTTIDVPNGWQTLIAPVPAAYTSSGTAAVFWRYKASGDPTSQVVTTSSGGSPRNSRLIVLPIRLTGMHATTPFEAYDYKLAGGTFFTSTTVVAPSVLATEARYLVCMFMGKGLEAGSVANALRWTPPTGMTELLDQDSDVAATQNVSASVAVMGLAGAGNTGTQTATITSTDPTVNLGSWFYGASYVVAPVPVPRVPKAPINFGVSPLTSGLKLTWDEPTDIGFSPITGYEAKVTPTAGGTTVTQTLTAAARTVTFNSGTGYPLVNGTSYNVTIAAKNAVGTGATAATTGTPAVQPIAPGSPATVTATPGNTQVVATWTVPSSDGGSPILDYYVGIFGGSSANQTVPADTRTATFTGLTNGASYTVQVRARNAVGSGSLKNSSTVIPYALPSTPTGLSGSAGDTQIVVSWQPPGTSGSGALTGYRVVTTRVSSGAQVATTDVAAAVLTATVPGLENGVAYRVDVHALSSYGAGDPATYQGTPTPPAPRLPTEPSAFTAEDDPTAAGTVVVSWQPPVDNGGYTVTGYTLVVKEPVTGTTVQTKPYGAAVRTDKVTGLVNGEPFTFTLTATTSVGTSPGVTATATPHPIPAPPSQVQNLQAGSIDEHTVYVSWDKPATGSPVDTYEVSTTPVTKTTTLPSTQTSITVTGLEPDTDYNFIVRALNLYGASASTTTATHTEAVAMRMMVAMPEPSQYAFPQPDSVQPPRVFRPANFGKSIEEVPVGE